MDWSDAQCLRAIAHYQSEHNFALARDFLKGGASELARTIGSMTAKEPERFGRLGLQLPAGTNPVYIQEILRNLDPPLRTIRPSLRSAAKHT
jgi:hypothetical protein